MMLVIESESMYDNFVLCKEKIYINVLPILYKFPIKEAINILKKLDTEGNALKNIIKHKDQEIEQALSELLKCKTDETTQPFFRLILAEIIKWLQLRIKLGKTYGIVQEIRDGVNDFWIAQYRTLHGICYTFANPKKPLEYVKHLYCNGSLKTFSTTAKKNPIRLVTRSCLKNTFSTKSPLLLNAQNQ